LLKVTVVEFGKNQINRTGVTKNNIDISTL